MIEKKILPKEEKMPRKTQKKISLDKKTVVFDLDETLAHCVTENIEKADHIINVKLNTGETVKVC